MSTTSAVEQLKGGREGLEQYRALVERVSRQVATEKQHATMLEAKVKSYLQAGERETAAKFALELQKAKHAAERERRRSSRCTRRRTTTTSSKIKHATKKLGDVKAKIIKYDAELKMSRAEAEMAKLANELRLQRHDRLRPDRRRDPGQDRAEPRQGTRRRRSFQRGSGRHQARRSHGKSDGRPGPARFRSANGHGHAGNGQRRRKRRRNLARRPKSKVTEG